jgi:hypothetical protein
MATIQLIDPGLKRVLDSLPVGDPDAAPKRMLEMWCPWFEGRHVVPIGETTRVLWGKWYGPPMCLLDAPLYARVLDTGEECNARWTTATPMSEIVTLTAQMTVSL